MCGALAVAGAVSAAAILTATAGAEGVMRDKADTKANKRILVRVRGEVKGGELRTAVTKFCRAGTSLKPNLGELKPIPRPVADRTRLSGWFGPIAAEVRLLRKAAGYLVAGSKAAAEGMVVRLERTGGGGDNAAAAFEFHYCSLEPTRFI
jgi:hypothetical protein